MAVLFSSQSSIGSRSQTADRVLSLGEENGPMANQWLADLPGPFPIFDKTSYRNITWSFESQRMRILILVSPEEAPIILCCEINRITIEVEIKVTISRRLCSNVNKTHVQCPISERSNYKSRGVRIMRDLTIRRIPIFFLLKTLQSVWCKNDIKNHMYLPQNDIMLKIL